MTGEPTALREQACLISISGKAVTIECDERSDAEEMFDWLTNHQPDAQAIRDALCDNLDIDENLLIDAGLDAACRAIEALKAPTPADAGGTDPCAGLVEAASFAQRVFANIGANKRLPEQQKALNLLADALAAHRERGA